MKNNHCYYHRSCAQWSRTIALNTNPFPLFQKRVADLHFVMLIVAQTVIIIHLLNLQIISVFSHI